MSDANARLPKRVADFVAKLAMVADDGPNSFSFIMFEDGQIIVFHEEISGYTVTKSELGCLVANALAKVSSYPAGPYPSSLPDDDDDRAFTGYFSLTHLGMEAGRLLSPHLEQDETRIRVLPPTRHQAGPSDQSSARTNLTATRGTGFPTPDELIASATKFLIEGREDEAASALLACSVEALEAVEDSYWDGHQVYKVYLALRGPRAAYDVLSDDSRPVRNRVREAVTAVLPPHHWLGDLDVRAELMPVHPGWRAGLSEMARGTPVNNQAATAERFQLWEGLRFRSVTETRIAAALDRAGVMFFPLCKARLNQGPRRVNREPDFLVCHRGKWGILEVDGEPWHPKGRAAEDHARDRLFKEHGIKVIEHFDAKPCYEVPDIVVKRFLGILENNG